MPEYAYKAIDAAGEIKKGTQSFDSDRELAVWVKKNGWRLLDFRISKIRMISEFFQRINVGGVSRRELIEFSHNMSVLFESGVPITKALYDLREDMENRYFNIVLNDIIHDLNSGSTLHAAMAGRPRVFPNLYVNIIKIGEQTGRLGTVFSDLAKHYKRIDNLMKNVLKATIYPAFVLAALAMAVVVFVAFVLPSIFSMFSEMDIQLPMVTRVLILVTDTVHGDWDLLLAGFAFMVLLLYLFTKNERTRYGLDWIILRVPYLRKFLVHFHMAFFTRYLSMLLSSGVDILTSVKLAVDAINNRVLRKNLHNSREQIISGGLLSESLRGTRFVPNMVIRMIAVGEETGNMDDQMAHVANQYDEELERRLEMFIALMEPILIVFIAVIAMTIIMGVLVPIYEMVGSISKIG